MRKNKIRSIWQEGGTVLNGWLHTPSGYSAEAAAHLGWDSLTIDMQHGPIGYQTAVSMLQAVSTTSTVPLARVPWNDPAIIMKLLDAGCYGLICPMINTRAEAEAFVGACRYAPEGYRSIGPNRAVLYGGSDYIQQANEIIIAMAMIETVQAMENLDEILDVPGLDAIYVGPSDLAQSLGRKPSAEPTDPHVVTAIDQIVTAAKKHGIVAGIHTGSPEYGLQMVEKGFQFITILSDTRLMTVASNQVISAFRQGRAEGKSEPSGPY